MIINGPVSVCSQCAITIPYKYCNISGRDVFLPDLAHGQVRIEPPHNSECGYIISTNHESCVYTLHSVAYIILNTLVNEEHKHDHAAMSIIEYQC